MIFRLLLAALCLTAWSWQVRAQGFEIEGPDVVCLEDTQSYEVLPTNGLSFPTGHTVTWTLPATGLCDEVTQQNQLQFLACTAGTYSLTATVTDQTSTPPVTYEVTRVVQVESLPNLEIDISESTECFLSSATSVPAICLDDSPYTATVTGWICS